MSTREGGSYDTILEQGQQNLGPGAGVGLPHLKAPSVEVLEWLSEGQLQLILRVRESCQAGKRHQSVIGWWWLQPNEQRPDSIWTSVVLKVPRYAPCLCPDAGWLGLSSMDLGSDYSLSTGNALNWTLAQNCSLQMIAIGFKSQVNIFLCFTFGFLLLFFKSFFKWIWTLLLALLLFWFFLVFPLLSSPPVFQSLDNLSLSLSLASNFFLCYFSIFVSSIF